MLFGSRCVVDIKNRSVTDLGAKSGVVLYLIVRVHCILRTAQLADLGTKSAHFFVKKTGYDCSIPSTNPALIYLARLDVNFYLTGSRFFGMATPESDWDFFTQHTAEVKSLLSNSMYRFEEKDLEAYEDTVWENKQFDVHVQLVGDVSIKRQAQMCMRVHDVLVDPIDKHLARRIWSMTMSLIEHQEDIKTGDKMFKAASSFRKSKAGTDSRNKTDKAKEIEDILDSIKALDKSIRVNRRSDSLDTEFVNFCLNKIDVIHGRLDVIKRSM